MKVTTLADLNPDNGILCAYDPYNAIQVRKHEGPAIVRAMRQICRWLGL